MCIYYLSVWHIIYYVTLLHDKNVDSILLTKTTAGQNEVALSYHSVRGLYFLAVFVSTISVLYDICLLQEGVAPVILSNNGDTYLDRINISVLVPHSSGSSIRDVLLQQFNALTAGEICSELIHGFHSG